MYTDSVVAHLGCFNVLAIVDSASVNIGVHVSFLIMVFSGLISVELLDHMIVGRKVHERKDLCILNE